MPADADRLPARRNRPVWLANWLARHRHPASFALHLLGIPLTIVAVVLAVVQLSRWQWDLWWRPLCLLAAGYLLQWIGHRLEGNDMGEIILLKKRLGRPFTAVSPRYLNDTNTHSLSVPEDREPANRDGGTA